MPSEDYLLKTALQFDVHKWSDFPEVNTVVNAIYEEIKALRKTKSIRIRGADKVKKHLKVVLIDLWAASKLSFNPYRAISKNKSDYQRGSRYRQIFLKFDYFVPVINDLNELGYITEKLGAYINGGGFRTRIKAEDKLINKILSSEFGVDRLVSAKGNIGIIARTTEIESELIVLRNQDGASIEYDDTPSIIEMRSNLKRINARLDVTRITLNITDEQHESLIEQLSSERNPRASIDFTRNQLYRIFNNSSFEDGGRFYGGWWQLIPKDFRRYIEINRKPIEELDYSGLHIRMLYAIEGLDPPDEPYDLMEFDRANQKLALLIMINADDETSAIQAMRAKGIRNAKPLSEAIRARHSSIKDYFFTGIGNTLMYKDSVLAEKVMLSMLDLGAAALPIHDSFIVRNSYAGELEKVMIKEFVDMFGRDAKLKPKKTVLEEQTNNPLDLETYIGQRTWVKSVWGF